MGFMKTAFFSVPGWARGVSCAVLAVLPGLAAAQAPAWHGRPVALDEVIRQTLAKNPSIRLQERQVELARGVLQQSSGAFDPAVQLSANRKRDNQPLNEANRATYTAAYGRLVGGAVSELQTDSRSAAISLDKTLRNGVILSTSVSSARSEGSNNTFNRWEPQNLGLISFSLTIPLLRNTGLAAAVGERANQMEWEASQQDLRQVVAKNVLSAANAYWSLLAAGKNLAIARESEASMQKLLEDTRKLIAADELPAAEVNLIQASLADRRSARLAAETGLLQARQTLGNLMGLAYSEIVELEAAGDFPPLPQDIPAQVSVSANVQEQVLVRRPDLMAARLRQEMTQALVDVARGNLRPQLNLTLGGGVAGISEGSATSNYYRALNENTTSPNASVALTYQWAFGNNAAEGALAQRAAAHEQAAINYNSLVRTVSLAVEATFAGLIRNAWQLKASTESVSIYRLSLENEKTKNRLGTSTILNVLNVNDSLRNARLAQVNNHLNYLTSLATLGYETGVLIGEAAGASTVDLARLLDMSWVAGAAR